MSPQVPKPREKPLLWLSSNVDYESTARKSVMNQTLGGAELLSKEDTHRLCGGLYRFVLDTDALPYEVENWYRLKNTSRMAPALIKRLVKRAKNVKAKPSEWYGIFETVDVKDLTIEAWSPENGWVAVDPNELTVDDSRVQFKSHSKDKIFIDEGSWES